MLGLDALAMLAAICRGDARRAARAMSVQLDHTEQGIRALLTAIRGVA